MRIAIVIMASLIIGLFSPAEAQTRLFQFPIPNLFAPPPVLNEGSTMEQRWAMAARLHCGVWLGVTLSPYFAIPMLPVNVRAENGWGWILDQQAPIPRLTDSGEKDRDDYLANKGVWLYPSENIDCFVHSIIRDTDKLRASDSQAFVDLVARLDASIPARIDAYPNRELLSRIEKLEARVKELENK
jgi:hypothetical protein